MVKYNCENCDEEASYQKLKEYIFDDDEVNSSSMKLIRSFRMINCLIKLKQEKDHFNLEVRGDSRDRIDVSIKEIGNSIRNANDGELSVF